MANISPKFGVVRLSVRCGGQVDVKVTQKQKLDGDNKMKKSGKKRSWKKKSLLWSLGGSTLKPNQEGSGRRPLNQRYLRKATT